MCQEPRGSRRPMEVHLVEVPADMALHAGAAHPRAAISLVGEADVIGVHGRARPSGRGTQGLYREPQLGLTLGSDPESLVCFMDRDVCFVAWCFVAGCGDGKHVARSCAPRAPLLPHTCFGARMLLQGHLCCPSALWTEFWLTHAHAQFSQRIRAKQFLQLLQSKARCYKMQLLAPKFAYHIFRHPECRVVGLIHVEPYARPKHDPTLLSADSSSSATQARSRSERRPTCAAASTQAKSSTNT